MNGDELQNLIRNILGASREYWQLKFGRMRSEVPGPPLDAAELTATERRLGTHLPPSFQAFLLLHRSWPYLVGDAGILSDEDREKPNIAMQIRGFLETTGKGPDALVVVAGESSHYLVYLDRTTRRSDGEMDVVEWTYEDGDLERHASFFDYLQQRLEVMRRLVRKERGKGSAT